MFRGVVLFLIWGASALLAQPEFQSRRLSSTSCRDWLLLLDLDGKIETALHKLQPDPNKEKPMSDAERIYWTKELASLRLERTALALQFQPEETAQAPAFEPGTSIELEPVPVISLRHFYTTRPQSDGGSMLARYSPDGKRCLVVSADAKVVYDWDLNPPGEDEVLYYRREFPDGVQDAAYTWDNHLTVLDRRGELTVYAPHASKPYGDWKANSFYALAFSKNKLFTLGQRLHLTRDFSFSVDKNAPNPFRNFGVRNAISEDAKVGAISNGPHLHILDLENGATLKSFKDTASGFLTFGFQPQSHRLVALTAKGEILLWDPKELRVITRFQLQGLLPTSLAIDRHGRAYIGGAIYGGLEGAIAIVDLNTGQELDRFQTDDKGGIGGLSLSPDEQTILTSQKHDHMLYFYLNPLAEDLD